MLAKVKVNSLNVQFNIRISGRHVELEVGSAKCFI